jgi:peptidoglycan glycosyltransferase
MQAFGFGEAIPFDGLPVAASQWEVTSGFLDQDDVSVAATAFGQGELLVTPMQMALVVAAVANDGRVPQPFVIPGPLKGLVPWRVALDAGMARQVAEIMRVSGRDGWARSASTPAIPVAGKTGTAEAPPGAPHAWYIGFAPADAPVVAFAVVVENGGEGSSVAAPVVAQMLAGWGKLGK